MPGGGLTHLLACLKRFSPTGSDSPPPPLSAGAMPALLAKTPLCAMRNAGGAAAAVFPTEARHIAATSIEAPALCQEILLHPSVPPDIKTWRAIANFSSYPSSVSSPLPELRTRPLLEIQGRPRCSAGGNAGCCVRQSDALTLFRIFGEQGGQQGPRRFLSLNLSPRRRWFENRSSQTAGCGNPLGTRKNPGCHLHFLCFSSL